MDGRGAKVKPCDVDDIVEIGDSRVNPGFTARLSRGKPKVRGLTEYRCPQCKRPLGEGNGTIYVKKCDPCNVWAVLKKPLTIGE
jgi:hypothetical protein